MKTFKQFLKEYHKERFVKSLFLMENQEEEHPELTKWDELSLRIKYEEARRRQQAMELRPLISTPTGYDYSRHEYLPGSPADMEGIYKENGLVQTAIQKENQLRTIHPWYSSIQAKIKDPLGTDRMGLAVGLAADEADRAAGKLKPSKDRKTKEEMDAADIEDLRNLSDEIERIQNRLRIKDLYPEPKKDQQVFDPEIA